MPEEDWVVIEETPGDLQAEILRGLLEAQGLQVWLNQEGAGRAYGLSVSTLGTVQILVPSSQEAQAKQVLEDYYAGKFEDEALLESADVEQGDTEDES